MELLSQLKYLLTAGKATGKYRNWYNIACLQADGSELNQSVDLSQPDNLQISKSCSHSKELPELPVHVSEDVLMLDNISFNEGKVTELENWKQNNVYKEDDQGQRCISTR